MHSAQTRSMFKRVVGSAPFLNQAGPSSGASFANGQSQSVDVFSSASATGGSFSFGVASAPPSAPTPPPPSSSPTPVPASASQPVLDPTTTAASASNRDSASSLSGGAVAGIVVGVLAAVALICAVLFVARRRRQRQQAPPVPDAPPMASSFHALSASTPVLSALPLGSATAAAAATTTDSAAFLRQSCQTPDDPWFGQVPLGTYTVVSTYTPTLEDEIYVMLGDTVQVYAEYDDGWCLGMNLTRGQARGVFPKHCVTVDDDGGKTPSETSDTAAQDWKRRSRRTSSLFNPVQIQHLPAAHSTVLEERS